MRTLESWQYGNPERVLEQKEAHFDNRMRKAELSQEDSQKVEELIMVWYDWMMAFKMKLGVPAVSIYAKQAQSSDVYVDSEEIDERIAGEKAEAVDACLDALPWKYRNAVDLHACNKRAKASVLRNPRFTREESHLLYVEAKCILLPMLRNRGLA